MEDPRWFGPRLQRSKLTAHPVLLGGLTPAATERHERGGRRENYEEACAEDPSETSARLVRRGVELDSDIRPLARRCLRSELLLGCPSTLFLGGGLGLSLGYLRFPVRVPEARQGTRPVALAEPAAQPVVDGQHGLPAWSAASLRPGPHRLLVELQLLGSLRQTPSQAQSLLAERCASQRQVRVLVHLPERIGFLGASSAAASPLRPTGLWPGLRRVFPGCGPGDGA